MGLLRALCTFAKVRCSLYLQSRSLSSNCLPSLPRNTVSRVSVWVPASWLLRVMRTWSRNIVIVIPVTGNILTAYLLNLLLQQSLDRALALGHARVLLVADDEDGRRVAENVPVGEEEVEILGHVPHLPNQR